MNRENCYAVLGVGVGGLYGGMLARSGNEVHFLARSDAEHLRTQGLKVESPWGDFQLDSLLVHSRAATMPQVDCAIVSWKTTANHHLAEILPQICHSETLVLILQNGLDIERAAADAVGAANVLGGCCFLCSNKVGPGHIRHLDYGRIAFGEYAPDLRGRVTERMQQLTARFTEAGIEITPEADLYQVRWKKLAWNIPFNGLSVVLGADTASLMEHDPSGALVEQLMAEVDRSGAACGVEVGSDHIQQMLDYTRQMVPYASSMLLDYQARRPMEVEAIFGNPLRSAQGGGLSSAADRNALSAAEVSG